jgi:hypothetical protein
MTKYNEQFRQRIVEEYLAGGIGTKSLAAHAAGSPSGSSGSGRNDTWPGGMTKLGNQSSSAVDTCS